MTIFIILFSIVFAVALLALTIGAIFCLLAGMLAITFVMMVDILRNLGVLEDEL